MKRICARWLLAGSLLAGSLFAHDQQLTIGAATVPSIDPHFAFFVSNVAYAKHVFGSLTTIDAKGELVPDLALLWKAVSPTTWEFKLRPNVKFHDGSSFTAEDVAFSVDRVLKIKNSPFALCRHAHRCEGSPGRRSAHGQVQYLDSRALAAAQSEFHSDRFAQDRRQLGRGFQFGQGRDRNRTVQIFCLRPG